MAGIDRIPAMPVPEIDSDVLLTYCLNVHPGETTAEVFETLAGPYCQVIETLSAAGMKAPFAAGLRLGAKAVDAFTRDAGLLTELRETLKNLQSFAPTLNAFPYGEFHADVVKEDVYRPDWQTNQRRDYTIAAGGLMASLSGPAQKISVSTLPGSFKKFGKHDVKAMGRHIAEVAAAFHRMMNIHGKTIILAMEPEPGGTFETTDEFVHFYEEVLLAETWPSFDDLTGGNKEAAEEIMRQHVGICFDTCHAAVEFEDPSQSLLLLESRGIQIGKMQLSSALHLDNPAQNPEGLAMLATYDEPRFLHQVMARGKDLSLSYFDDLGPYLAQAATRDDLAVRAHFHVPVFADDLGCGLKTTQDAMRQGLGTSLERQLTTHFEVETYSWDLLPERRGAAPSADLPDLICHELEYVAKFMA